MKSRFAQFRVLVALAVARWLIGKEVVIVPALTLASAEAQIVVLTDYIALHSGRLNDGTTRPVRKKLRNACQVILSLVEGCYEIEQGVGKESKARRELVPSGL